MSRARWALAAVGVAVTTISAAALIQYESTPAAIAGHPDPHGGASTFVSNALAAIDNVGAPPVAASQPPRSHGTVVIPRRGLWIEIPSLNIALPVFHGSGSNQVASRIADWKAFVYPGTAWPGQPGNSFIYAHGQWGMFGALLYARAGDVAYLHDYTKKTVRAFRVSRVVGKVAYNASSWITYPSAKPMLTLETCVDWNPTGDRFIVQLT